MNEKRAPLYAQIAEMRKLYDIARQDLRAAQAENEKLRKLLARYRNETPLGHQPHMIAHEADKALALSPPPLSPEQAAADLGAYGVHITKDGERIAPEAFYNPLDEAK